MAIRHQLAYEALRVLGNFAFRRYMSAARDGLGAEWYRVHQWALKRAHTLRVQASTPAACSHQWITSPWTGHIVCSICSVRFKDIP